MNVFSPQLELVMIAIRVHALYDPVPRTKWFLGIYWLLTTASSMVLTVRQMVIITSEIMKLLSSLRTINIYRFLLRICRHSSSLQNLYTRPKIAGRLLFHLGSVCMLDIARHANSPLTCFMLRDKDMLRDNDVHHGYVQVASNEKILKYRVRSSAYSVRR